MTLLSFLLALLPIVASADESGTCGDNLTWTYVESTHTLTISGNGDMSSYSYSSHSPWYNFCSSIEKVIIENGVTSIGSYAFDNCSNLTSVTIPNSVTSIGYRAFLDCSGLTSVTLPNSVTFIGSSAFYGTPWYNNLPEGVLYAGNIAYGYKGDLSKNSEITIKEGTIRIADRAFVDRGLLTSVDIPNSVTSIGYQAFYGCSGLTSVTIPNSVTSIGSEAFWY